MIRTDARVCSGCGYHHPRQVGVDICENCGATLAEVWRDMLQLQQVVTRPRQRISADEEERNRVGFELRTTYRFTGEHAHSRADAVVRDDSDRDILEVTYGDAAEIRVANLGRRGRANKDLRGFNLDLIKGRWLSENPRPDEEPDDDFEANQADVQVKARVTPFVEDRRNIAVLRWVDPVDEMTAVTAQYALERGLEATFQLEDSELASETAARQRQPRTGPADRGSRGRCRGPAPAGHRTRCAAPGRGRGAADLPHRPRDRGRGRRRLRARLLPLPAHLRQPDRPRTHRPPRHHPPAEGPGHRHHAPRGAHRVPGADPYGRDSPGHIDPPVQTPRQGPGSRSSSP